MRSLSRWAFRHKWKARLLVLTAYGLLICTGFMVGDMLHLAEYYLSPAWIPWLLFIGLASMALYPQKGARNISTSYAYRKTLDAVLTVCSFSLMVVIQNGGEKRMTGAQHAYSFNHAAYAAVAINERPVKPALRQQKQVVKQWVRAWKAKYRIAGDDKKALLIFLTVLVALGLGFLVVALSCSIACNSSGVLALIVLLGGLTGIALLGRTIIRRIRYGPKPKQNTQAPPATGTT